MFVSILNGHIVRNEGSAESQSCLTIAQMKHFYIKHRAYNTQIHRHSKSREMPLPIYFGLSIHTMTKNRILFTYFTALRLV